MDVLNTEMVEKCKEKLSAASKDVFDDCSTSVKAFLEGEPFRLFRESMYFHRYLQWKWLERYMANEAFLGSLQ